MNLELITWVKDGCYRIRVLEILCENSFLPSELADKISINRASISRILKVMKDKKLVSSTRTNSRTISYSITPLGKKLLKDLKP
ncbi:MAG: ArsR family transcriptional regulator [Candidatus Thermoplasmatota archaeon]|nr:ArsR family transcriptional regulator [Candidatus Thermoplasmatota archaeon]